jgi:hypothetical protein
MPPPGLICGNEEPPLRTLAKWRALPAGVDGRIKSGHDDSEMCEPRRIKSAGDEFYTVLGQPKAIIV